jgi:hypothetical protein
VESNRPKSPEAFDFTQTEAAIVWCASGVCLEASVHRSCRAGGPWLPRANRIFGRAAKEQCQRPDE